MTHALLLDLAGLRVLARQVLEAHKAEDGPRLREVAALVADLLEDLSLPGEESPEVQRDHAQLRLLLADLRCLTHGYHAPDGCCATWRELWRRLAALEDALLGEIEAEQGAPLQAAPLRLRSAPTAKGGGAMVSEKQAAALCAASMETCR